MVPAWLWVALVLGLGAGDLCADISEHPYACIAARNVFGLNPPRPQPPQTLPAPLTKVKLVGITTLCGTCALLKIYLPAQPPEPAREAACTLKVGRRDGSIEVLEIDAQAGSVRVRNSGAELVLMLDRESAQPQTPPRPRPPQPPPIKVTLRQ